MAAGSRPLIAGNWKMNGLRHDGIALATALVGRATVAPQNGADVLICPPFTLVAEIGLLLSSSPIALGAQDCHAQAAGAHTGDISAEMLADLGCRFVIVGHSERRSSYGESYTAVRAKAQAAHRCGMTAVVCLGERTAERDAGRTLDVVSAALAGSLPEGIDANNTVIAYEPVWAIGTGRTLAAADIEAVHGHIRALLDDRLGNAAAQVRLLYGGSVNAGNAAAILALPDVNGALVGGASLDEEEFWTIVEAAP
jgi:triosephosphate isomerase